LNHDRYVLHDPGTNCSSDDGVLTLLSRLRKKGDLAEDETCMAWRPPWKMKTRDLCFQSNADKHG